MLYYKIDVKIIHKILGMLITPTLNVMCLSVNSEQLQK
jgi:hypothetical protein